MKEVAQIVEQHGAGKKFTAFSSVYYHGHKSRIKFWFYGLIITAVLILFLPWTQHIRAKGTVTTLRQEQRTQEVNTVIAGKIIRWHVKEGDYVQAGDTLLQLAEVKDSYLDPQLLDRTSEQLKAKATSVSSYESKAAVTDLQIGALSTSADLKSRQIENKIQQLQLKITADSMDMIAARNDYNIAQEQYRRQLIMRDSGLASQVQVEQRAAAFQNAVAKKTGAEIKLTNTRTDLVNARIELNGVQQEYAEKMYKAQGDRAAAISESATGRGEIAKLKNQYASYALRAQQYYVLAPQSGQVVQSVKAGINEIVKEGDKLLDIVPDGIDYAVEIYVRPLDLPLVRRGQQIAFLFDGYPAIVFSGWPQASWGMFYGKVTAIETSVSANGMFRILVAADTSKKPWPPNLTRGTGASAIALLNDVPVWYELWRNINGFPPDFYQDPKTTKGKGNTKK